VGSESNKEDEKLESGGEKRKEQGRRWEADVERIDGTKSRW
jgi:hypothetical protein